MTIEYILLHSAPVPADFCYKCGATPFEPFLRGSIQRSRRSLFSWPPFKLRPYCAIICRDCKGILGYEMPKVLTPEECEARTNDPFRYELEITRFQAQIKGLWKEGA